MQYTTTSGAPREIAFIDRGVDDLQTLLSGLRPGVEAFLLADDEPALPQMARRLQDRSGLDAVHVIAHGQAGEVHFGAGALTRDAVVGYRAELASMGSALGGQGRLLLWSCNTAAGARGAAFIADLQHAVGAEVAAADHLVGTRARGASWELDGPHGQAAYGAPLTAAGMDAYAGVLVTFNTTTGTDAFSGSATDADTIIVTNTDQIQAADTLNGGSGTDTLQIGSGAAGATINLSAAATNGAAGFLSIEALTFVNSTNPSTSTATFSSAQFGTGLISSSLAVTGTNRGQAIVIDVVSGATFSMASWTFATWNSNADLITINGAAGAENITGSTQPDFITGGAGADALAGGASNDTYTYASTSEAPAGENIAELTGNGSQDTIRTTGTVDLSALTINGAADFWTPPQEGIERVLIQVGTTATFTGAQLSGNTTGINESADSGTTTLTINVASGTTATFASLVFTAFGGGDAFDDGVDIVDINGSTGAENITGTGIADNIDGGSANDTLIGGAGADTITGGAGDDSLTGSAGNDIFVYQLASDSPASDTITDFTQGEDLIDLTAFRGASDLEWGGTTANTVWGVWYAQSGGNTHVYADTNGDFSGDADLHIILNGTIDLTVDDFLGVDGSVVVNDPPDATNLDAAETYTEDTALNLIDIVITDADSANVTATLTLSNTAAGSLSTATSGGVTSTYVAGTGVWTASGALADVNTLLAGVTFNPALNFNGNFSIATSVDDGDAAAITGTKDVTGTPVNDAPDATNLNAAENYGEGTPLNLINIVVSDVDSANVTATLTLSNTAAGSLSTGTSGAVTSTYVAGTGVWTASGALANVNTLLAGVIFTPAAGFADYFTIDTSVDDGDADPVTGTKSFTGTSVAPTLTISDNEPGTSAGDPIVYTFQFSEPVTDFTAGDIVVGNGSVNGGTFTTVDSDTYTVVITPYVGLVGNMTVDVPADSVFDSSDNGNTAATQSVQAVEAIAYTLYGDHLPNRLVGGGLGDSIYGEGASDTLIGNGGNDYLDGGCDADSMNGGAGNDTYIVDCRDDKVVESLAGASGGTDIVWASVSFTLPRNVEHLTLVDASWADGTGNGLANEINGSEGDNRLLGLGGNDTLTGSGGNDTLSGGTGMDGLNGGDGYDTFVFDATPSAANLDTVFGFEAGGDMADRVDRIKLLKGVFGAIGTGTMTAATFEANSAGVATSATTRIIYDTDDGRLLYDYNGNGAGGAKLVAVLVGVSGTVDHTDFYVALT